jgi:serine/threonine-protein kinase
MVSRRRKKIWWVRILITFAVLIFIYIIVYQSIGLIVHSKKEVIVPNIENKSVLEALKVVSDLGLGLKKVAEVYNSQLPAGTIVNQQPQAGMTVRKGKIISVVVSLGGEKVFVPNVVGEDKWKAEVIIRQYGLVVGSTTECYSLKYSKGKVLWQSYPEGSIVDKNTPIDLKISLGFPPEDIILMPDFINKNFSEVKSWAETYGLQLRIKYKPVEQILQNDIVIEQIPSPDSVVTLEDVIEITLSQSLSSQKEESQAAKMEDKQSYNFEYELPFMGNSPKNVKIVQISDEGEHILYNKLTLPKEKILLYVPQRKNSKLRIFVDGILIDEK